MQNIETSPIFLDDLQNQLTRATAVYQKDYAELHNIINGATDRLQSSIKERRLNIDLINAPTPKQIFDAEQNNTITSLKNKPHSLDVSLDAITTKKKIMDNAANSKNNLCNVKNNKDLMAEIRDCFETARQASGSQRELEAAKLQDVQHDRTLLSGFPKPPLINFVVSPFGNQSYKESATSFQGLDYDIKPQRIQHRSLVQKRVTRTILVYKQKLLDPLSVYKTTLKAGDVLHESLKSTPLPPTPSVPSIRKISMRKKKVKKKKVNESPRQKRESERARAARIARIIKLAAIADIAHIKPLELFVDFVKLNPQDNFIGFVDPKDLIQNGANSKNEDKELFRFRSWFPEYLNRLHFPWKQGTFVNLGADTENTMNWEEESKILEMYGYQLSYLSPTSLLDNSSDDDNDDFTFDTSFSVAGSSQTQSTSKKISVLDESQSSSESVEINDPESLNNLTKLTESKNGADRDEPKKKEAKTNDKAKTNSPAPTSSTNSPQDGKYQEMLHKLKDIYIEQTDSKQKKSTEADDKDEVPPVNDADKNLTQPLDSDEDSEILEPYQEQIGGDEDVEVQKPEEAPATKTPPPAPEENKKQATSKDAAKRPKPKPRIRRPPILSKRQVEERDPLPLVATKVLTLDGKETFSDTGPASNSVSIVSSGDLINPKKHNFILTNAFNYEKKKHRKLPPPIEAKSVQFHKADSFKTQPKGMFFNKKVAHNPTVFGQRWANPITLQNVSDEPPNLNMAPQPQSNKPRRQI